MNRLYIEECLKWYRAVTGQKMLKQELAKIVFEDSNLAMQTKQSMISNWNTGANFSGFKLKYLRRLKEVLGVSYDMLLEGKV